MPADLGMHPFAAQLKGELASVKSDLDPVAGHCPPPYPYCTAVVHSDGGESLQNSPSLAGGYTPSTPSRSAGHIHDTPVAYLRFRESETVSETPSTWATTSGLKAPVPRSRAHSRFMRVPLPFK